MKEIFQLPDSVPKFYTSTVSAKALIEFGGEDVLYVIGTADVTVVEGEIEIWGYTMTADGSTTTLYSSGLYGLIPIRSASGQKAIVSLAESVRATHWKTFMNDYAPKFNVFGVIGTRLTPPKAVRDVEEQLGCWFDLSKSPISHQRLVIEEQWEGVCADLLGRPVGEPIKVLLAGYKNSGKTTMMNFLINRCLKKWNKILVLDFDIGQTEFYMPTCISAFVIDKPLLGPNFTHLIQPYKSYVFGSSNCLTDVPLYNKIVEQIVHDIKTNDLHQMPCFINTMGFVEGPGLDILYNLISKTEPTDVIQLKFNECQNLNLHSSIINDEKQTSVSYNLWYFVSLAKNKLAKAPYLPNHSKHHKRDLVTTSYFSECLKSTNIHFNDVVPYLINISDINIQINDIDELTQDEYLDIINANVIALCISSTNTDLCECVGFGIVRSVNKIKGDVFVTTPVPIDCLNRVNLFKIANINLPLAFYTKGTQMPKYVCVKQNNIFNENITRQYKVMS